MYFQLESNNINSLIMFKQLNSCNTIFKKVSDLNTNTEYHINKFRCINTRFGDAILVELSNFENEIILPSRFSKMIPQLDEFNKKLASGEKLELVKSDEGLIIFLEGTKKSVAGRKMK